MTYIGPKEFYLEVQKGKVKKHSIVHKFGEANVGTSLVPVCEGGFYRTPTTATALEFVSSSANDTASGSGAREITIVGLNSSWAEVEQTLVPNGTTPVALTTDLIRHYRWFVSQSGTYASQSAGSHAGTLTIREASSGPVWSEIGTSPFPEGQSEIGAYTIPLGFTGYVLGEDLIVDSSKSVDAVFFTRPNANDVTVPFTGAIRALNKFIGVTGSVTHQPKSPIGPFAGPCDIGFMAKVSASNGDVSVDFELLLVED